MNLHEKFKRTKKRLNQRGQAMVLYVIFFPILFMFVCVGFDMGWYYLNVSRLQNAAEAAAIAGANKLKINNDISNVNKILLVNEYAGTEDIIDLTSANAAATDYANKNLSSSNLAESGDLAKDTPTNTKEAIYNNSPIKNSWTKEPVKLVTKDNKTADDEHITTLYQDNKDYYYYVVLQEEVEHFMMPGWFDPMSAEVHAVAKLTIEIGPDVHGEPPDSPNDNQVLEEEDRKTHDEIKNSNVIIGNWELQNGYRKADEAKKSNYSKNLGHEMYSGAWNHFQDTKNHYKKNALYRTETITLRAESEDGKTKTTAVTTLASINTVDSKSYTYNPGTKPGEDDSRGNPYEWQRLDSINLDLKQDVGIDTKNYPKSKWLSEDWDLPLGYKDGIYTLKDTADGYDVVNDNARYLRIHTTINIENPYPVRSDVSDDYYKNLGFENRPDTEYPDVLWARIESEPMIYYKTYWKTNTISWSNLQFNSVRQFIININQSNADTETVTVEKDGEQVQETRYKHRPIIFFYDGPERYTKENHIRDSKPVILNLKKDFRGVLYAPDSPVVILEDGKPLTGNAKHKFNGFIVAKNYLELITADDPEAANYTKITENGIDMYIDNLGNVQYKYPEQYRKSYGTYDNFERTDFTSHGYPIPKDSEYNLFFSSTSTDD